jgi:Tol biopolymer transport system component
LVGLNLFAVLSAALLPHAANANCNLIPAAAKEFRSTLGTVDRTIAAPGQRIAVRVDLACNPTGPGFDPVAASNRVFVRFVPPGSSGNPALVTELEVPASDLTPANCPSGGGRCDTLLFPFPDAALDAALPPDGDGRGLTGPVEIRVENLAATVIAQVGPLFEPTLACSDQQPESVFGHLTAIPRPNSFSDIVGDLDTTVEATIDGNGNLLIPVDYSAVLPNGPGSAVFRILQGSGELDAFSGVPGPIAIPGARYLRSFNLAGRPIPPVLETTGDGTQIFGTVDAQLSIIRIARTDPDAPGPPLYDLSDRLLAGRGPIVIANANATARESAPLATLSADALGITFGRSEAVEGIDLNGDGDFFDRVPQVIDVQSGVGTSTGLALAEVTIPGFARPVLQSGDGHVAFGVGEGRYGDLDLNGDGDVIDSLFRVFDLAGNSISTGSPTLDPTPVVAGKPLAISNGLVFFRSDESDGAPRTTIGLTPTVIGIPQQRGDSDSPSASGDGRLVAFVSSGGRTFTAVAPDNALRHIYLYDRETGSYELIDRTDGGVGGDAHAGAPSISRDGRYVAYHSAATNLPGADADGAFDDVFLYDRQTQTTQCVSCAFPGVLDAVNPDLSADATFIAYGGTDSITVWERATQTTTYLLAEFPPFSPDSDYFAEGVNPSISDGGRYVTERFTLRTDNGNITLTDQVMRFDRETLQVAFIAPGDLAQISANGQVIAFQSDTDLVTDDTNLASDAYVWDEAQGIERISVNTNGQGGVGGVGIRPSVPSDDGRFIAFIDDSGTEVPGAPGNRQVFRYDRTTNVVEAVSVPTGGGFSDGMSNTVAISGDGQTVAFAGFSSNLAPDLYTDVQNVFVRGSVPGVSLNAADADITDTVLQVFDIAAADYRIGARVPAETVAVTAGRAAILSSEAADGGGVRNNDGDATDSVARIVDGATGVVTETGVAASAVAISEQIACMAVNEAAHGGASLNGDGDADDDLLFVRDLVSDQQTNTGITVNPIGLAAAGSHCVFTTAELLAPGMLDLNGDGDPFDDVLGVYDAATAIPTSFPYATADLVAKGDLVAFRVCEEDQGNTDLNFDSDPLIFPNECVMHVLTLSTGQVENTQRAASACTLPGCDPFFEPFRVSATTVSFLSQEEFQSAFQVPVGTPLAVDCKPTELPGGCDLSGDADTNDSMITVYNVRSGLSQLVPVGVAPDVAPFPTEIGDSGVLYVQVLETDIGEDVNGDGQVTATPVLVLVGDADGDGALDDSVNRNDSCVEVANPDQLDADRDQLGDGSCDPAPTQSLPGDVLCDVDSNGQIDRFDVDVIFGDRGAAARSSDPRDADGDGQISVLDSSLCRAQCTYASCRPSPPTSTCGFGAELVPILGVFEAMRRGVTRRRRARKGE